MNSPRFYFDIYKRYVNTPDIANLKVLEINTTGTLSSQMWKQLCTTITVESDLSKVGDHEFDFCHINLTDYNNLVVLMKQLNLQKRPHGTHYILLGNKVAAWENIKLLQQDEDLRKDGRMFYTAADLGVLPYKIKKPDQTVIRDVVEPEATLLEYR
jgi:arginyl-tRNA synthetase